VVAGALGVGLVAAQVLCDGVILADGSCAAAPPPFDPVHANEGAFVGGVTGTFEDAGININDTNLRGGGGFDIPSGGLPSPLFGAQPFTQRMLLFEEFGTDPYPTSFPPGSPFPPPLNAQSGPAGPALDAFLAQSIFPAPTRLANEQDSNPWETQIEAFLGRQLDTPPAEGRPPGENWAHQRWAEFPPVEYFTTTLTSARVNGGLRDDRQRHGYNTGEFAPGGLYHNTVGPSAQFPQFEGTTAGISIRLHPNMPIQDPQAVWTFDGTLPPKLLQARYGRPILMRNYNALPIDPSANFGFGLHTITTHEHNGHQPAESDGNPQAFFFPGEFYDYRWPLAIAGRDSINTGATNPRAGAPDGNGGIINLPGDPGEVMSTHWFHDHMLDFTAQNVYKGNAVMMNYYSSVDRGREPASAAEALNGNGNVGYGCHYANPANVNLCLPSGSGLDWGNRDYDVQLLVADKAWDQDGQLFFDIFNFDGYLGDQMTVNWLYKPYFEVRARRYRFRILDGAVSRYVKLALVTESDQRVPFHMIANDGNLMEHAVYFPNGELPEQSIAERYDIIVDFSQFAPGTRLYLVNLLEHVNGRRPQQAIPLEDVLSGQYQALLDVDRWINGDPAVGKFLEFRVVAYSGTDRSMDPAAYVEGGKKMIPRPVLTQADLDNAIHRTFEFGRSSGTDEAPWTIKVDGGTGFPMDPRRVSAAPRRGALQIWHIMNGGAGWSHPVHVHFEESQILRRNGQPPPVWERWARKDMYRIGPMPDSGDSVDIAVRFREFLGSYVEHCHNTQHEDHAMLLRWDNENPGQVVVMPTPMPTWDGVTYVDSHALPTARSGDPNGAGGAACGDGVRNQPNEQCDGTDDAGCPGACRPDCTCSGPVVCGDNVVNQVSEDCDGTDDTACPGACLPNCICDVLPVCGDGKVNHVDEECDGADDAACPGACMLGCKCGQKVFCDTFNNGLANWTESGEGDWNTEALHATTGYPATGSGSPAAHSDNCDTTCTITLGTAINLQGRTSAQLTLLRFVDSELDPGEYLRLQAWNGSAWQTLADWSADNASDTNLWHAHTFDLAPYLGRSDFRVRFVTHESNDIEHVHADDVCITANPGGPAPTTTTTVPPPPTTTTTVPPPPTTTTTRPPTTTTTLAPTTTTTTVVPATTTTTTLPPVGPVTLFYDPFAGLTNWTESGEGDWNTEALHATTNYPATGSNSPAAHSDTCTTSCEITMTNAVNLSGRASAQLTLLRFVDSELDAGEYLRLEVWNGSTWVRLADWSADNAADTNRWEAHAFDLAAYLGRTDFKVRFVTKQSNDVEHVQVDDVKITATAGTATTTTTLPPTTTTTTLPPVAVTTQILADTYTESTNGNSNFGSSTILSADHLTTPTTGATRNIFLRVSVSGIGGRAVNSATMRLTVANISNANSNSGGRIQRLTANCSAWNEGTLTFNSQPVLDGTPGPAQGAVALNQVVNFDVTSLVRVDGTYCFVITTDSTDGVDYNSREAASGRPQLIITQ